MALWLIGPTLSGRWWFEETRTPDGAATEPLANGIDGLVERALACLLPVVEEIPLHGPILGQFGGADAKESNRKQVARERSLEQRDRGLPQRLRQVGRGGQSHGPCPR